MTNTSKDDNLLDLCVAVEQLVEQMELLRNVIDELREEIQWRNRNRPEADSDRSFTRLTSMPLDPAGDWTGRVNAVPKETIESLRSIASGASTLDLEARQTGSRPRDDLSTRQRPLW